MDESRARALIQAERTRVQALLKNVTDAGASDRTAADQEVGDYADPAERLTAEEGDDAVAAQLRSRLAALDRAELRLENGTYGRSVRSGEVIPDDRLEADPAAELTVEEEGAS